MYKHILIPTDGSELSNKAIRHGVFMKQLALPAAVLALLSVTANAQYYGKGKAPPPPPVVTKG